MLEASLFIICMRSFPRDLLDALGYAERRILPYICIMFLFFLTAIRLQWYAYIFNFGPFFLCNDFILPYS